MIKVDTFPTCHHSQKSTEGDIQMESLSLKTASKKEISPLKVTSIVRNTGVVIGGTLLLALASKISIPFEPVPITMQSMAVFFIGMMFGARMAAATLLCYIAELACGLPFASGFKTGLPLLFGPTGGYVFGWLLAAIVSGALVERGWGKTPVGCFFSQILGSIPMYGLGLVFLSQFVGLKASFDLGFTPFILGDILKISALSLIVPFLRKNRK